MGYVPLAMGYDALFVDTRTCNLLYTDLPTCVLGGGWHDLGTRSSVPEEAVALL